MSQEKFLTNRIVIGGIDGNTGGAVPLRIDTGGRLEVDASYSSIVECFSNGSGGGKAVGETWTETTVIAEKWRAAERADSASINLVSVVVGTPSKVALRIRKRVSSTVPTEYLLLATNAIVGGVEDCTVGHTVNLPVTTGNWCYSFRVEKGYQYAVEFIRTGGTSVTIRADISFVR
jgi:hypothetical protein